jgi:hypothetical protein
MDGITVTFDTYRDVHDGTYDYDDIVHHGTLAWPVAATIYLPLAARKTNPSTTTR